MLLCGSCICDVVVVVVVVGGGGGGGGDRSILLHFCFDLYFLKKSLAASS